MKQFIYLFAFILFAFTACKNNCKIEGDCSLVPELEICDTLVVKYYYNQETNQCEFYNWCGSPAIFETMEECEACICHD